MVSRGTDSALMHGRHGFFVLDYEIYPLIDFLMPSPILILGKT
jgi:hypothetical protein